MKILHTADWHLGKIVNAVHMTADQREQLNQLFTMIETEQPDLLIIPGDIYDRSIPPKEAVDLLDQTLTRLVKDFQLPVLITSGNHDSPDRLQFGHQLFKENQLYIETKLKKDVEALTFYDQYGPVTFHLIPYFEPEEVNQWFLDERIVTHQQATEKVIEQIESSIDDNERHVVLAHTFMAGGMESDSEDRLSMVGGSPYVDADLFKAFDYVALGHLHQPQKVKHDHIQYSGSLMKYSFSEANHKKSAVLVELLEKGKVSIRRLPFSPRRDLRIIEGLFEELMAEEPASDDYLLVRLFDDAEVLDVMSELRKKFPNVLRLEQIRPKSDRQLDQLADMRAKQTLSKRALFSRFYQDMIGEPLTEERQAIIDQAIQALADKERGE
ncbi:exodeoxyribonuclease I subunit D [Streptohalobacillus salinus]|uniref:Nuclease SbcCD subunit D n=1 Tax=Streptohalobacillus salinus TaxID=621096 RepID=A0A2V3WF62_9BACI|nr:exonuclease SbcCD subunit D [Streptohalobacillus salinus]PXW91768.1 exodeoxyribonuclease I subunit D [Streptohalobacillus salinus]